MGVLAREAKAWSRIADHLFAGDELTDFLISHRKRWQAGTTVERTSWILHEEEIGDEVRPMVLKDFSTLPMTRRIDGILPFTITISMDVALVADEMLRELRRFGYEVPVGDDLRLLRQELGVAILAIFHGREFRIEYGLALPLRVECPLSPTSGRKEELLLMGELPLGGRTTIFSSSLPAKRWLDMDASAVECAKALELRRKDGQLLLGEAG